MIESINFRTGISTSLLRTAQATIAEIPQRLYPRGRNAAITTPIRPSSVPQTVVKRRQEQWLVQPPTIYPDVEISTLESNPRQWLLAGNPRLASLITATIGDRWIAHLDDLQQLAPLADDPLFQSRWRAVKQANKQALAHDLERQLGINLNVNSLWDLQLQPIGTHHRQLLNILHIIGLVDRIKQHPDLEILPRTFIFGNLGKLESTATEIAIETDGEDEVEVLPNYDLEILELIQSLAKVLATDPDLQGKLEIVYLPDAASLKHQLYAAADVTEQLATAAMEDVDLSALQAAVNGVLSIGSLGKTNYWIQQTVGEDNYFGFGLAIPEIALFKQYGYDPYNYYKYYPEIRQAIDALFIGSFTPVNPNLCRLLVDSLLGADEDMVMADYIFYAACQARVSETYCQQSVWTSMSILNVAGVG
jgi:glycogen phosphorylase